LSSWRVEGRWLGGVRRLRGDELHRGKGRCRVIEGRQEVFLKLRTRFLGRSIMLPLQTLVFRTGFLFGLSNLINSMDSLVVASGDP